MFLKEGEMEKRKLLLPGLGLMAALSSTLGFTRTNRKISPLPSLPVLYAGTWKYRDPERNRHHRLTISPNLTLKIDHQSIPVNVEKITLQELTFVDRFGYRITIETDQHRPVKLIDEADDQIYDLQPLS
ncbi:hypothetical protein FC21_GL000857 [Limosilactobacillus equigenerosi DSM 18793 = JCM 14505]|uniref:DUF4828 domain-containing protein n=2 Tax=Limosilactobacillus TaxID=2742598 RepID=A0A0R1UWP7_9LACO|nr:hypothetical protein FC21_GL000857 [Limosilactobacillus equigenerosi DSM 18793 = JCM 14505]